LSTHFWDKIKNFLFPVLQYWDACAIMQIERRMIPLNELSKRILDLIDEKGLSYGELSAMTKIPKSALQRYATGGTEKIPLPRIEAIAKALGVSSAYLIGWNEENQSAPFEDLLIHGDEKQPPAAEELSDMAIQIAKLVDRLPDDARQLLLVQVRALAQGIPGQDADE
jgi:transcriptional regulator with XRE-family HTH domain